MAGSTSANTGMAPSTGITSTLAAKVKEGDHAWPGRRPFCQREDQASVPDDG